MFYDKCFSWSVIKSENQAASMGAEHLLRTDVATRRKNASIRNQIAKYTDRMILLEIQEMWTSTQRGNGIRLAICPASTDRAYDGNNSGQNCGCYDRKIAGTLCEGMVQRSFAAKAMNCLDCDFYKLISDEERIQFACLRIELISYRIGMC